MSCSPPGVPNPKSQSPPPKHPVAEPEISAAETQEARALAAGASGTEIMQAKCGCHGPGGKGGKAPVLVGNAGSEDNLYKIIHDGKGKMPAFSTQLSEAQVKTVVTTVRQLK